MRKSESIRIACLATLLAFPCLCLQSQDGKQGSAPRSPRVTSLSTAFSHSVLDINNLWIPIRNDGILGCDSVYHKFGTYPKSAGVILYSEQLVWTGKVKDGRQPELRAGGGYYNNISNVPGSILSNGIAEDPSAQSVRVYRYRPDFEQADLTLDASSVFDTAAANVTAQMVATVRDQYRKDLNEWPWQKGAPFVDKNGNGVMDPGELPGLQDADQVAWFVYNDLDETNSKKFGGSPPTGLEVQVTLWAYKDVPILQDVVFKRYRMIYKGGASTPSNATIDSMYITQFADPDIGNGADDYGGCDSVLSLGYAFNGPTPDRVYSALGMPAPGLGYVVFQGPTVPGGPADAGLFNFQTRRGVKNLPMTSFALHVTGGGDGLDAVSPYTYFFWDVARGCKAVSYPLAISNQLWVDPTGKPTMFMCSGDPLTKTGWYAGSGKWIPYAPGDARIYLNSGPFTMAAGDTQEVVIAIMASPGADGPNNSAYLKYMTAILRGIYPSLGEYVSGLTTGVTQLTSIPKYFTLEQNYPNPFNPSTSIKYSLPADVSVRLVVYDVLGREVRVLRDGNQKAGEYALDWDGRDAVGNALPSGVYFYRLEAADVRMTRKLILMR